MFNIKSQVFIIWLELAFHRVSLHICFAVNLSEDVLAELKSEIKKVKNHYELHKVIYDKVAKREQMWSEFLTLEVRISLICFSITH